MADTGTVEHPDDPVVEVGSGWKKTWKWLDGLSGGVARIGNTTEGLAGIAGNIADGQRAIWEVKRDKEAFNQDQFLELFTTKRGDNVKLYYAGAAVATAVVFLLVK